MATRQTNKPRSKKHMYIPGLNFGERMALLHYSKRAGMSPDKMARMCISEMAYQIAMLASVDEEVCVQTSKK